MYGPLDDKSIYFRQVLLLHTGENTVSQEKERPGLQILVFDVLPLKNVL